MKNHGITLLLITHNGRKNNNRVAYITEQRITRGDPKITGI
jgi:hypothetical protein